MKLHIASGLDLPLETVTQTIAILAKRRAGKSYTARRLAEQLLHAGQQVVIVDPKGDWWGIRSGADGRSPGLPVVLLGGERGDVPLEAGSGDVIAKLAAEERVSMLLDLSLLSGGETARFMAAFLEGLYRLKAREAYRTPMMLLIDEADAIAPQRPQKGEERMLGAADTIVRRGGQRGIGSGLVTQRSAVLNKNALTQAQVLIALRTIAPQDLKAMEAWIDVHGTEEQRRTLMESLPSLPTGDAWFWSPGWPTGDGIFKRVHILPIETFDSGATPKPGEKRVEPKNLADVNLEALRRQMAATIERAKAEDPRALRAEIARLKQELAKKPVIRDPEIRTVEKGVLREADRHALGSLLNGAERLLEATNRLRSVVESRVAPVRMAPLMVAPPPAPARISRPMPERIIVGNGEDLTGPERKLLTAVAQHGPEVPVRRLAILTGYAHQGGGFRNPLSALRSKGHLAGREAVRMTEGGAVALGTWEPLPAGRELLDYWLARLPGPEKKILSVVAAVYPRAIGVEEAAAEAGYEPQGGGFRNPLSRLRTLDLVSGRGELRASEHLFP